MPTPSRPWWAILLAVSLLPALAAPAHALVEDPLSLLGATVDTALDNGMKNINADKLVVVVLRSLPADADGMATFHFKQKRLPSTAGVIMVGTETGQVGTFLGEDFTSHGVTPAVVQRLIRRVYVPEAKRAQVSDAVLSLVQEIKLARTLGRDPELTPLPVAPQIGMPWWWYLPPLVLIGLGLSGYYGARWRRSRRRRARLRGLVDRLEDLQWQLKRLEPALAQLAEVEGIGGADPTLEAPTTVVHQELAALRERAKEISQALKQGEWEQAEGLVADGNTRMFPLATRLAALLGAHQARLAAGDPAAFVARAEEALARWQRLSDARGAWAATQGSSGQSGPQQLGERLESLVRLLTTAPLDLAGAEDLLDATEAIFGRALNTGTRMPR